MINHELLVKALAKQTEILVETCEHKGVNVAARFQDLVKEAREIDAYNVQRDART